MRLTSAFFAASTWFAAALWSPGTMAHGRPTCEPVDAGIVTMFVRCPTHFASPVGVCTEGKVDAGVLKGHTRFRALTIVPGSSPDELLYTGELIITTREGTLTLHDSGVLNTATGQFFEFDVVVGGTGEFKDATGTLTSQGFDIGTGFIGDLNGVIFSHGRARHEHHRGAPQHEEKCDSRR